MNTMLECVVNAPEWTDLSTKLLDFPSVHLQTVQAERPAEEERPKTVPFNLPRDMQTV